MTQSKEEQESAWIHSDPAYLAALSKLDLPVSPSGSADPARCSIAVLPFNNMSAEPDQEFLADGIAEDILTELSRLPQLAVISRNSSFVYKGRAVNVQAAGRELGVDFILEGSVRKSGDRVRVTAQLIDCGNGAHAWAERYDRRMDDIFVLQDDIVAAVVGSLSMSLEDAAALKRTREPTSSNSAYTIFLKALAKWRAGDEIGSRQLYQQAIEKDPQFARALAKLAHNHAYGRISNSMDANDHETVELCKQLASRAIGIDSRDPNVLEEVALVHMMLGEPAVARGLIESCVKLAPRSADTISDYGVILSFCGDHEKGLELNRAGIARMRTVPIDFKIGLSLSLYLSTHYADAAGIFDSIPTMPPYCHLIRSACLAQAGLTDKAREAVEEGLRAAPKGFSPTVLARNIASMCAMPVDAERLLDGFRKAGVSV